MIYVLKDQKGQIIDLDFTEKDGYEKQSLYDSEIKKFIADTNNDDLIKATMTKMDLEMVRVTEDIIDILIQKEIMLFTDLPEAVQNKLMFKRFLRQSLTSDQDKWGEDELLTF